MSKQIPEPTMTEKKFFKYVGLTVANGRKYMKGDAVLVIYTGGTKRYWRNFDNGRGKCQERNSSGTYIGY